jgi:hypothetical protein
MIGRPAADENRVVFETARRRVITVRGAGARPLAGVRLAPHALGARGFSSSLLPDAVADPLEVTTGADGTAELGCLAPATALATLRATIPGVGTQVVALPPQNGRSTENPHGPGRCANRLVYNAPKVV